ncbi:minor capsid protein [Sphingobium sp. AP50]|uniref:minor capsid protein n=1 Tax=Sphingobium sp. AP50 TaxID=1884369 RepID=UPI0021091467|nr:minor capsid protein [Sphingobium sp. AP50]
MPWLDTQEAGRLRALEGALQLGILQGQTTGQMVQRIRGTKAKNYSDGVLNASRNGAQTIARTATAGVQNASRLETYRRMKTIKFVEWSSVLDSRTSDPCQSLSGKIYPIDDVPQAPPIHPNCRSTLIPRRDNEGTKHRPFPDWLRDQSADVQDGILGKARGEIFRANPKMNYDAFFKEVGGRRRTLKELREYDASLFGEKAAPAPKGPGLRPVPARFTSPIDPDVSAATIAVLKKKDVTKALNARMAASAADPRYDPRPEFRDVNVKDIGKAVLNADFTDEAASMIAALMPELEKLADAFAIPRLRAIKSGGGTTTMGTMGDGVLRLNPVYINGFAAEVGGGAGTKVAAKVIAERDALAMQLQAERDAIDAVKVAIQGATGQEKDDMILRYLDMADAFNAKRQQWLKLDKKVLAARRTDSAADRPVSQWKPGDDVKEKPFNAINYFERPLDRARMLFYHEFAHHVHQMRGKQGRRSQVGTPPIEKALAAMFRDLTNYDNLPSRYSSENGHEWWAESFGLYFMGRKDLADPKVAELIERLLDEVTNGN